MYARPIVHEIDLTASTSSCYPTQTPQEQCEANGGVYLSAALSRLVGANCLEPGTPGEAVGGWVAFVNCMRGNGSSECEAAIGGALTLTMPSDMI